MKLRDAITAGVKPLAQNKLRAGLSILGIFIGIAGVLCMIAIGDGAKRIIAQNLEMMGGQSNRILDTDDYLERSSTCPTHYGAIYP